MKTKFNRTWLVISLIIILFVVFFTFASKSFEKLVADDINEKIELEDEL
jgi:hypothetical protein